MATVFNTTSYPLQKLVEDVSCGDLALPDIQRPFVWNAAKVRDLFDSLYRGFPVGYLVLWENNLKEDFKDIGTKNDVKIPKRLIIDGQQRLTSLYTVFKGAEIVTKDFKKTRIKIAFRPLDGKFEVSDAAISKDPEFISDISELWSGEQTAFSIINNYLQRLSEKRSLSPEEQKQIQTNIENLLSIQKYQFTAIEISANLDEETVANIFVRINSQGVNLTQADFVLTLLSVFWEEGRNAIEEFCIDTRKIPESSQDFSAFNHIIKPDPDDILKVAVGLAFKRAKMQDAYSLLRGKDLETEEYSIELRDKQFGKLKNTLTHVLDNTNWHSFLKTISSIGYKSDELISSKNAVINSYLFYLMGKINYKLEEFELQKLISKWFLFSSVTARYSASPESTLEGDLNKFKIAKNGEEFKQTMQDLINSVLTNDYWEVTLINSLDSSFPKHPAANAYYAALIRKGSLVLFSTKAVADLFDPSLNVRKKRLERHHIFPKNYLNKIGVSERRMQNQIANLTYLEFEDNIKIADDEPKKYFTAISKRFNEKQISAMLKEHGIPNNFYEMDYTDFLIERRKNIAKIIRGSYESI